MELLVRALVIVFICGVCLAGCEPEISRNTYFCGPDALCPPNLACQFGDNESFSYNCVLPREAETFSCPVPSADREPDDEAGQGRDLGEIACGEQVQFENWGCIEDGEDVDRFRFTRPTDCVGSDPRAKLTLRFPLGAAPLSVEIVNDAGQVESTGVVCTSESDSTGTEQVCIDQRDIEVGTYDVRISIDAEANADCGGACRFNHYQLVVASPVS